MKTTPSNAPKLSVSLDNGIGSAKGGKTGSRAAVDCEIAAVFQDSDKQAIPPEGALAGLVERLRDGDVFTGRAGATQFFRFGGKSAESALVVGLGQAADLTEEKARQAGGSAFQRLSAERARSVMIHVDTFVGAKGLVPQLTPLRLARAFAEGLLMPAYQYEKSVGAGPGRGKLEAQPYKGPTQITFVTDDKNLQRELDVEMARVAAISQALWVTRDWSNLPSNIGTPEYFANEAKRLATQYGLRCRILTERECLREKMGLFLGVSQGAEREGRVVVLEYAPKGTRASGKPARAGKTKGAGTKTLALVGKGVTFDSGGISIKPSARMEDMKHDMTGAATVMGAMILAAEWGVPNRVVAYLGFAENMPDGNAIQPGNVIASRAGKTVEIINTDAEGRLILADLLDYAQDDCAPDAIVDIATLTGAVNIALGKQCCAILGSDDGLIEAVRRAGDANGERIWQLPLWDEYFEDLKSDWADMRNSANDSYGGTIRGAIFLKQYIRKGTAWAHLDIAGTAYNLTHLSYYPKKGASGAYVRTLAQLALDL